MVKFQTLIDGLPQKILYSLGNHNVAAMKEIFEAWFVGADNEHKKVQANRAQNRETMHPSMFHVSR